MDFTHFSQTHSTPLSPRNHKNINCRSDWRDQGHIEQGTPTPRHLWMWKKIVLIFKLKNMLKFKNFWKCTPEMYLFRFLNTPLGGGGQHRRLPRAANTLAPTLDRAKVNAKIMRPSRGKEAEAEPWIPIWRPPWPNQVETGWKIASRRGSCFQDFITAHIECVLKFV